VSAARRRIPSRRRRLQFEVIEPALVRPLIQAADHEPAITGLAAKGIDRWESDLLHYE
jgi:hypothetical protein